MDDLGGLMRGLGGAAGGADAAGTDPVAGIGGLASALAGDGGLDDLMGRLQAGGLGDVVGSWVGGGQNQPIDPQQLGAALGPEKVQRLASASGLDIAALLPMLAAFLPQIVDMLTPDGAVPDGGLGGVLGGVLGGDGAPDLGGLLGGLGGMLGGPRG